MRSWSRQLLRFSGELEEYLLEASAADLDALDMPALRERRQKLEQTCLVFLELQADDVVVDGEIDRPILGCGRTQVVRQSLEADGDVVKAIPEQLERGTDPRAICRPPIMMRISSQSSSASVRMCVVSTIVRPCTA